MSLLAELRRRNVFRAAIAWLASSWVLVEIASVLFPELGLPRESARWLIVALAFTLVPVMAFAWRYELTPQGLVPDRGPGAPRPENARTARRLDQVTIAMVLVALGVQGYQRFVVTTPAVAPAGIEAPVAAQGAPRALPDPASVAVLPFANLSPEPADAYFADGVAEEVLAVLSRVEGLKVASRTSSFSFRGTSADLAQIAQALRVAHLLEGSVRRQAGRVRVTAQLLRADDGLNLWSETYERDVTDIFAVQEDIARSIASALGAALGVETAARPVRVAQATQDFEAYELYLRGRQLFFQRGEALVPAAQLLEQAVARDPEFAEAWAVLAVAYLVSPDYLDVPRAPMDAKARDAALRARELDDSLALPHAALGLLAGNNGELLESVRLLDEAIRRDAGDSTAHVWRSMTYLRAGDFARAEADAAHAVERDPLVGITHGWYGLIAGLRGDAARRDRHLARSVELGWNWGHWLTWRFALAAGDRERAARHFRLYLDTVPGAAPSTREAMDALHAAILDPAKNDAALAAVRADTTGVQNSGWASTLAGLGLHDEAIAVELDPALPHGDRFGREVWYPTAVGLLERPRYLEIAERDGLLAYWEENGYPEGCRMVDSPERRLDCGDRP